MVPPPDFILISHHSDKIMGSPNTGSSAVIKIKDMCCSLLFEDGQMILSSSAMSLRQGGGKKAQSSVFFKHHLTVTALTDPLRLTDSLSVWGRGRMDGSTRVDKGHKAKIEGNAQRGRSKGYSVQGGRQQRQRQWCFGSYTLVAQWKPAENRSF